MQNNKAGEFETALARLEAIVKQLETEEIGLDRSVDLYKEGKKLAGECERLLLSAQSAIEAASAEPAASTAAPRGGESLFDDA